jgi:hypothetical protein
MTSFKASIAMASCVLTLSAGVAFATDLHNFAPTQPGAASAAKGQTGSNVLSSCSPAPGGLGVGAKPNVGNGSPFNPSVTKGYAGNPGNPATNPKAVAQYDNACAQAALRQMP